MITLREKLGQLFMIGVRGEQLNAEEQSVIDEYGFGGFVLFKNNCREPRRLVELCRSLWDSGVTLPPFIAIDQEGGSAHRLPTPFTHFPGADKIGRAGNPELAYRAGRAVADELLLAGVNLNFAPVLDVNSNPSNPVIGERAFAGDPATVMRISEKWLEGLRAGGIIPCGKHFPGHGDTDKDSHRDLPVVTRPLAELEQIELPPFVHACKNHIESLMTAHVVYQALDPALPATLSEKIITGLLRHQWGYEGVVFSDALEMKAIGDRYSIEEVALLCAQAGVDVLLYCDGVAKPIRSFEFLYQQAEKTPALRAQIERSYTRVRNLKEKRLNQFTGAGGRELNRRLAQLEHGRLVDEIYGSL